LKKFLLKMNGNFTDEEIKDFKAAFSLFDKGAYIIQKCIFNDKKY
jgi:Ca2+-binding EF-hand superfamily protein